MAHFPNTVSEALVEYARDVAFLKSRYLFVWRVTDVQMAYCTHCKTEFPLGAGQASFKHNEKTNCLSCQSECVVKSHGRGRKHLIDSAYVVWYEKSVLSPNAIVARAMYAYRDYSKDYRETETMFTTEAIYLFEPGSGGRQLRRDWNGNWTEMKSVSSYVIPRVRTYSFFASSAEAFCSQDSIERAVKGTPLQYSMWREYEDESMDFVKFFDLAAKYPCVEYLTKMGLCNLVAGKLKEVQTYGAVNWRGKTINKVLRMPRADVRELVKLGEKVGFTTLKSYHFWRKLGWDVTPLEAHVLRDVTDGYHWKMLSEDKTHSPVDIAKYLLKQMKRPDAPKRYNRASYVLTEWRDTLRNCQELGLDITKPNIQFPTNLAAMHDKVTLRVKMKRDEEVNRLIQETAATLADFGWPFTDGQFIIRPANDSIELFNEGKALNTCVGGYANKYASGQCIIFFVRLASDPETPYCTVEVVGKKIVQARGYKNSEPEAPVQAFLKRFEQRLRKRKPVKAQRMAG